MRPHANVACFLLICNAGILTRLSLAKESFIEESLKQVEPRLRAIYDQGEYQPKTVRPNWLPDSSGYTIREPALVRYDVADGKRTVLDSPREDKRESGNVSPDGRRTVYSDQGNLYVRDLRTDEAVPLTNDPTDGPVSNSRAVWSPDGTRIAYVQSDASRVRLRPMLVPGAPTYSEVKEVRFARVGGIIPTLRVGVVDAQGNETRWLPISMPVEGFYLGQVNWAENSDEVLVEKLSRFRDEREFLLANVHTGAITRIFHESDPAWVVASYGKNAGLEWIHKGRAFVVLSAKDGWRRAYVYSRDGKELCALTPDGVDIIERAPMDEEGGWSYYYASPENATQKYLYRVRLDRTGDPERITPQDQPGTHDYDFSPDANWAFHTYSSFDTPPVMELVKLPEHRVFRVLEDNEELRVKMAPLISQPTEFLQLEIGDGVEVDAWMIKPDDFDPERKYPVFVYVYVYGKPHAQTVLDGWGHSQADFHA